MVNQRDIRFSQREVNRAATTLEDAEAGLKALKQQAKAAKTRPDPAAMKAAKTHLKDARKFFQESTHDLKAARGSLLASVGETGRSAFYDARMRLGFGKPTEVANHLLHQKVGLTERLVSKPFRVAANHPGATLFVGSLLAMVGIGSMVHRHAARTTQENALAAANQPMAQANSYQVTPEEWAQTEARMRQGAQNQPGGHAERIMAAKQPTAATPVETANLAAL